MNLIVCALLLALAGISVAAAPPAAPDAALDIHPVPALASPSALPEGWQHGAFMEVFVRGWRDSDGDGIGDLRGLTQTLDHLQELGVRGIWLMPVTANADGDHGYATTDFRAIAPEYGTLQDFDELLRQAHRRGIGVIMDYVINHAAAEHPMFLLARDSADSPWRDWFVWADEPPQGWDIWGKNPWYHTASQPWLHQGPVKDLPAPPPGARGFYFGTFGPHMPDFNFHHPQVLAYHEDSLRFWLNRGLDGFRLDAVPHLVENSARDWNDQPQSRALTKRLQTLIKSYPRRHVVCEATAKPGDYGDDAVCGGAFAFGHVQHHVLAARGQAASVEQVARYYLQASPNMAAFVSNHDIFAGRRLWDQVEGDPAAYRMAAAGYLLQPGTPFIYYGEEVGQAGVPGLPADQPLRGPLSWAPDPARGGFTTGTPYRPLAPNVTTHNVQTARQDPHSLWAFYRAMLKLRNTLPSMARGSYEHARADGLVAQWQRRLGRERSVVLINYGRTPAAVQVAALPRRARLHSAHPAGGALAARADVRGVARLVLAPQSVRVLLVR